MFVLLFLSALSFPARAEEPDAAAPTTSETVASAAVPADTLPMAEVKVRAMVRDSDFLPDEAFAGRPEIRCTVRLSIDEKGVPYDAAPQSCEKAAFALAREVGMRYRFYPVEHEGKPVKARFDLTITFKVRGAGKKGR